MVEQYKYKFARNYFPKGVGKALEIGIGNDSPLIFKKIYPDAEYYGIDKTLEYNLSDKSKSLMDKFYLIDLEKKSLDVAPDNNFDYVIIAHVIEHLTNGEKVINELCNKVKNNGGLYIEYPRKASARFPSMKGTLNFYDDPTHKRFYEIDDLKNILIKNGFKIIKSGVKRDFMRIVGLPLMIIKSYAKLGYLRGSVFWDLLGFADYILAEKER